MIFAVIGGVEAIRMYRAMFGMFWVNPRRLLEVLDGLAVTPDVMVTDSPAAQRHRMLGLNLQCIIVVPDGPTVVLSSEEQVTHLDVRLHGE